MPLRGELIVEGDSINMRATYPADDPIPGMYIRAVEAFNKSIIENTEPPSSGYDGIEMVRVVDAILASGRTGRAVRIKR